MISRKQIGMRARMLIAACATLYFVVEQASYADEPKSTIQFQLLDVPSGKLVPAMVCIRNLNDESVRLPPDGRVMQRVSQTEEFYRGVVFDANNPDWIGPPRKTLGKGNNNDRSYVYDELPSIPFWREPVLYQTQPAFSIKLEPGRTYYIKPTPSEPMMMYADGDYYDDGYAHYEGLMMQMAKQ